jgi:hypothetical protein
MADTTGPDSSPTCFLKSASLLWHLAIVLLVVVAAIFYLSRSAADNDLYGHLRFGLDILEAHAIPQNDPYSYLTAGQRWINHEWLSEVSFAFVYKLLGPVGLVGFKTIICLGIGCISYFYLIGFGLSGRRALIALCALLASGASFIQFIRPQLFTYLMFLLLLLVIKQADAGNNRSLWLSAPIMLLWANLHGGYLAGIGVIVLWAILAILLESGAALKIALPTITAVLITLVNPYGLRLPIFLLRTATIPRPEIIEWQPINFTQIHGLVYLVLLAVSCLGYRFAKASRSRPLFLLLATLALYCLTAVRHLPLFGLATIIIAAPHFATIWNTPDKPLRLPKAAALLPLLFSLVLLVPIWRNFSCMATSSNELVFPAKAVGLIKASGVAGNLATEFNWGEYVIWHLGPEIKVSIDGRRETVYSTPTYRMSLQYTYGSGDWDKLLTEYKTDMALIQTNKPTYNLMTLLPDWSLIFKDSVSALFVPSKSPLLPALRNSVPEALDQGCFKCK